jgi:hypothetical protein
VETAAIAAELALSAVNERRLARAEPPTLAAPLEAGRSGRLFRAARWSFRAGLALRLARGRGGPAADHAASALLLAGGLASRFAWVAAGRASAADDETVARAARAGT